MQPMRRKDRALSVEEGIAILEKAEYGVLALKGKDDYPHAIPMSFAYSEGLIYVHAAKEGYKTQCIEASNACCFTVVGDTQVIPADFSTLYESCLIYGKLEEVSNENRAKAFEAILNKYSSAFMASGLEYVLRSGHNTAVYQLSIELMSVKGRK